MVFSWLYHTMSVVLYVLQRSTCAIRAPVTFTTPHPFAHLVKAACPGGHTLLETPHPTALPISDSGPTKPDVIPAVRD